MTRTAPHRLLVLRQLSHARQRLDLPDSTFTAEELRYLRSLPAVVAVSAGRIRYTEAFKRVCMRQYRQGKSPARIFREAGLDSALIGYKRIERCIARWRNMDIRPTPEHEAEDNAYKKAVARWRQIFVAQLAHSIATDMTTGTAQAASAAESSRAAVARSSPMVSSPVGKSASSAAGHTVRPQAQRVRLSQPGEDLRDLLIAQQIRRIRELERTLERLRANCTCGAYR